MGTPVDLVPDVIRAALAQASNAPGYPAAWGTPRLRAAAAGWLARSVSVSVSPDDVLQHIAAAKHAGHKNILIRVEREGSFRFISMPIAES